MFPTIFNPSPIEDDLTTLHCTLFSIQYACAKSWLDVGLKPDRLIGHSFGQLTALCVSGSLSLAEAIRLVSQRARLLQKHCGPSQSGLMLAVEGKPADVEYLIRLAEQQQPQGFSADIACYNGPQSFVIAGDEASIQAVEEAAALLSDRCRFRTKRLDNSHAFHSRLMDGIVPGLRRAAKGLRFEAPAIPVEPCVADDNGDDDWNGILTEDKIVRHTREPVYFMDAVRRIERQAGDGAVTWLEAGSGSPVMPMIKRAAVNRNHQHLYIATPLRSDENAQLNLANATSQLWGNGVRAQFWPFHAHQREWYNWVNLPPYQFAKTRHWLDYQPNAAVWKETSITTAGVGLDENHNTELIKRLLPHQVHGGAKADDDDVALFEINTKNDLYRLGTQGHEVVDQSLCPASMYVEFALVASHLLVNGTHGEKDFVPRVSRLTMSSPLVLSPVGRVFLKLQEVEKLSSLWDFSIYSLDQHNNAAATAATAEAPIITHGTGRVTVVPEEASGNASIGISSPLSSSTITPLRPLQSLILQRCQEIEHSPESVGYRGPTVYKAFRPVVTYVDYYRGIQSIYNLGREAVARITMPPARPSNMGTGACDPVLIDSFTQVSGVLANCFALGEEGNYGEETPGEMWVCNFIGDVELSREFINHAREVGHAWTAYGKYEMPSPKRLTCDVFVFEPRSGNIVVTIRSIEFQKVSVKSLSKILGRLNNRNSSSPPVSREENVEVQVRVQVPEVTAISRTTAITRSAGTGAIGNASHSLPREPDLPAEIATADFSAKTTHTVLVGKVREMLKDVLEIPIGHISPDASLETLGIDSLLATELFSEMRQRFAVSISHLEFAAISDVQSLAQLVFASSTASAEMHDSDGPASLTSTSRLPSASTSSTETASTRRSTAEPPSPSFRSAPSPAPAIFSTHIERETIVYGERDGVSLSADLYYPSATQEPDKPLPIGGSRPPLLNGF